MSIDTAAGSIPEGAKSLSEKGRERSSAGEARSGGTGVYTVVHEDSEHRATPDHDRATAFQTGSKLHMGIAEQGKVYSLAGKHALALMYYRQAMHMAVRAQDPEVFFRHYLECIMESLEHMGAYQEVLEYCAKAIEFYAEHPPPNPLSLQDLAHVYERQGAVLLKQGEKDKAAQAFEQAVKLLKGTGRTPTLIQTLLRWIKTGMHIDPHRVLAEQKRTRYFSVRNDTVDPKRAVKLPDEQVYSPPAMSI